MDGRKSSSVEQEQGTATEIAACTTWEQVGKTMEGARGKQRRTFSIPKMFSFIDLLVKFKIYVISY